MADVSRVTWSDTDAAETVTDDAPRSKKPAGRRTVLPRVELNGQMPCLVEADRARFQVLDRLGEGGLGEVVAARDLDIGRKVAIKTIRPDRRTNAAFLRFVQEVRIVGQLDHPNIVPVHDVGRDEGGGYYFVMKCVEGETLESVIAKLRAGDPAATAHWTFERRVEVFRQVLQAVHFAHVRGVVHRDLKPANVMVGRFGEVQLLDWGVARALDLPEMESDHDDGVRDARASLTVTTTRVGALIGTPRYMSPEQARGERIDERSDVWALSLLLYELITLQHYLDGIHDLDTLLRAIAEKEIVHPANLDYGAFPPVPAELAHYVMKGLQRDPKDRYPSVAAMIERMNRRMDGEIPIECAVTFQKSLLSRVTRWIDRHPATSVVVLVGTAVVAAGSVLTAGVSLVVAAASVLLATLG